MVDLNPGSGLIVPEHTWHRAIIHQPSRILFVTPLPRTQNTSAMEE